MEDVVGLAQEALDNVSIELEQSNEGLLNKVKGKKVKEKEEVEKKDVVISESKKKKLEALEKVRLECEKEFGKNAVIKLDGNNIQSVPMMSTNILSLDEALSGGFPKGRIVEIMGPESSGKTSLALHAIAQAQKNDGVCAFCDAEHALDPTYAKALGVTIDDLYLTQPDSAESALEIVEKWVDSGALDVIVVDSVSALIPQAEVEGDMGDSHVGLQARLMSQAMRKLTSKVSKSNVCLIFINQIRMKIGVRFGNPETTSGGNALKFYASLRLDVRKIETIGGKSSDEDDDATANKVRIKVVKSKVGVPFRKCELLIKFGEGYSAIDDTLDLAVKYDIIHKAGSWFSYKDSKLGQGRDNVYTFLTSNPDVYKEVFELTKTKLLENKNK